MASAATPPVKIRVRHDLQAFPRRIGDESQWVIKDPVSFSHFLFSDQEIFLLELFDGQRTLEQIRKLWQQEFQTLSLTAEQLQQLTQRFIRDKLVLVEQFGNGLRLLEDEQKTRSAQWMMKLSSPLVIKLGGIDPRGVLDWLWLPGQILFNRLVMIVNLIIAAIVFVYLIGHFEDIAQRAATMAGFFSVENLLLMSAIIVVVKILHELGHATACRKFGGECFEIGVLLLAFFPTLYCDVSDSWTFAQRWKRIVVSFAGIYIEILLATIAAVLWLVTGPGFANSAFFNLAIMCSVNTLFVNGNPFLRYDGYYIASDLFEQPNLSQTAKQSLRRWVSSHFFDVPPAPARSAWLALFGFFSFAYRVFVIIAIVVGVDLLLRRFEFGYLSDAIACLLLASVGFRMLKQRRLESRSAGYRINVWRSLASLLALGLFVAGWLMIPVPTYRYCNVAVEALRSSVIYAPQDGQLDLAVASYDPVSSGTQLGQIKQPELAEQQEQNRRQIDNLEERSKRLVRRFEQSPTVASDLQLLKNELKKAHGQAEMLAEQQQSLTLNSPLAGTVRPLQLLPPSADRDDNQLELTGSLLDAENADSFVRRGQPLLIVEGSAKKLVSYLGEKDVEFLEVGQSVTLAFDQLPHQKFAGQISQIIEIDAQLNETEARSSGLETFIDQIGDTQTLQTPYRVMMSVDKLPTSVLVGSHGRARVSVPMRTLAQKTWFWLDRWWQERNY